MLAGRSKVNERSLLPLVTSAELAEPFLRLKDTTEVEML